jgi:hypothetical protein
MFMVLVRQNRSVKRTITKEDIVISTFNNTPKGPDVGITSDKYIG